MLRVGEQEVAGWAPAQVGVVAVAALDGGARCVFLQTVAQSRLEQQNGSSRGMSLDECVVPNEKARMAAMIRTCSEAGVSGRPGAASGGGKRRDRQGGLRWLFNSLRTSEGASTSGANIPVRWPASYTRVALCASASSARKDCCGGSAP